MSLRLEVGILGTEPLHMTVGLSGLVDASPSTEVGFARGRMRFVELAETLATGVAGNVLESLRQGFHCCTVTREMEDRVAKGAYDTILMRMGIE